MNLICSQHWHSVLIQLPAQDGIVRKCDKAICKTLACSKATPILGAEPYYNHKTRAKASPPWSGG